MKKVVAVALSGGIDSAVAATLLKEEGFEVIGLHFLTGYEIFQKEPKQPQDSRAVTAARRSAERIGIPLEIIDCSRAFQKYVVQYFAEGYRAGLTPNPCIVCNRHIKFGLLVEHAKRLGANTLATGHYARIGQTAQGRPCLLKGLDPGKEQSYFLARLTEQQLDQV
ncbi:MAG: tRNA 2-thiouridine(34) synthase MnmA, partial [Deltaproteobacteria bacterium]|nr:tRNA 2-thiouridine(34) synthase MnmA [Deltaproteobacteria bacterium]